MNSDRFLGGDQQEEEVCRLAIHGIEVDTLSTFLPQTIADGPALETLRNLTARVRALERSIILLRHQKSEMSDDFPPCNPKEIPHYTAYRSSSAIKVDGKLDEKAWKEAPRSNDFKDLITGGNTIHSTQAAVLWDDDYLYVGYWIEEPDLQATLTERDAPIYKNNDVELFIAAEHAYYEFEINAFGTIYEVLFVWEDAYKNVGYDQMPDFNLERDSVRSFNGVGLKTHPKGKRIGFWNWDFPGLKSAVWMDK